MIPPFILVVALFCCILERGLLKIKYRKIYLEKAFLYCSYFIVL
jgi:hypothetical protein